MADDFGFQPSAPQSSDGALGFQPIPKVPDVSGVQKMAQDNIAANDNKTHIEEGQKEPATPQENLNTAVGQPVHQLLNPDDQTPINPNLRKAYTGMLQNGSASNFGDALQTILHTVAPIAHGIIHPIDTLQSPIKSLQNLYQGIGLGDVGGGVEQGATSVAAKYAAPFLSDESQQKLVDKGILPPPGAPLPENAAMSARIFHGLSEGLSPITTPIGAPFTLESAAMQAPFEKITKAAENALPTPYASVPGDIANLVMTGLAGFGLHKGAADFAAARYERKMGSQFSPSAGPWDNLPGKEPIADLAAKQTGNPNPTSQDIDQHIVQGTNHKAATGEDFKSVATVTGIPEKQLHNVYAETGVAPDQVFTDAQQNPSIAADVAAGKVPEQYEHLVALKPVMPEAKTEALNVVRDDTTHSFNVVDKDGDHVSGGFDSAQEAQHYIEDEKFRTEERAAIEQEAKVNPIDNAEEPTASKYTIKESTAKDQDIGVDREGRYVYEVVNKDGIRKGFVDIDSIKGGIARIGDIVINSSEEPTGNIGVSGIRDILRQIREKHPEITSIEGERVSGARKGGEHSWQGTGVEVKQKLPKPNVIPPSETGKITPLRSFLSNNGAKFNEANELLQIKKNGEIIKGADALEYAHQIAKEHGYLPKDEASPTATLLTDLQNALSENGGRDTTRTQDVDRVAKAKEALDARKNLDINKMEHEAHSAGIDTGKREGETDRQYKSRLAKALTDFYKNEAGSGIAVRKMVGDSIIATEKFTGKLTGDMFGKAAEGYIKTFQPELVGDKALRADAYLAKYKASLQEAQNSYYRASEAEINRWEKAGEDAQKEWLYDHETGRWNEEENPDHARTQAMYDALRESEQKSGVGSDAYKENYLPHQYENPEAVEKYFRSDDMIKKYGKDWFNKSSVFQLIQEADRAGFKLKTYNPERMLVDRQQASYNMIATMNLLHDFEESGVAKKATAFTVDKKIAKTEQAISEIQEKYKKQLADIEKQKSLVDENGKPIGEPISMQMSYVQDRLADLNKRLEDFKAEKSENKLTPEQMKELKDGFRVIGPDSHAWMIHQQVGALWKNAMDMKGLYEDRGLAGDAYRKYMAGKAVYVRTKMLASLFHPTHEAVIDISSDLTSAVHHLVQGGKISDLIEKSMIPNVGIGKYTAKLQDNPQMQAWNTPHESRTPEQQADVTRMIEGGFVPTVPRENAVKFKENFNKAINGIGKNNLRLLGTALELPSLPMAPLMEHWIPGMKTDSYFQRTDLALARDPSLANDAGRRGEVFRKIAQDIEHNYGEMNRQTQFWNPIVRDIFNATTFSGGWKLAMLQNFRGLAEPTHIAYNWAKTGEFSKEQITHQMLQSYIYTANMLMLGAGLNYLFTGAVGTIKDWINPQTGDKNADGTPVRLRQPAFFNEPIMLLHDIYSDGVVPGTGSFFYHQTLIPGIANSLLGRDFVGRPYITDPTDLHQWINMGLDSVSPIALSNQSKAEERGSSTAEKMGWVGFPMAGAYINQTPFEQKIIGTYYALHPSEGGSYQSKLKSEMRGASANHDAEAEGKIESEMKHEQMKPSEIASSRKQYTTAFSSFAWSKLSSDDQKRLIESASPEEKQRFKVKSE